MEDIKNELKKIYMMYGVIHKEMNDLQEQLADLGIKRTSLEDHLTKIRDKEKELINKLESHLNRKITQDDLFKIISENA